MTNDDAENVQKLSEHIRNANIDVSSLKGYERQYLGQYIGQKPLTTEEQLDKLSDEAYEAVERAFRWGDGFNMAAEQVKTQIKAAYELGKKNA